jgi:diphthine-ammonia ligase
MTRPRAAISWSGGKDSLAALAACRDRFDVVAALTMFDEAGARSRSHGLRPELVAAQADRLGLRPVAARCGWDTYNDAFREALRGLADDGITHVVFGDLVYPEHREWAEQRCAEAGVTAVEPLWGTPTDTLFDAFVASGARALLVTVREPWLDASWLGRPLAAEMKPIFLERGIDPCGERGEYHTAVVDSPLFSHAIAVTHGETVRRGECVALDLAPGRLPQGFGAQDAARD